MERGDFYASTGVEITDYVAAPDSITITIKEPGTTKSRTTFIGKGGAVLATVTTNPAVYKIRGDEGYVRAKVVDSNGKFAWLQPLVIRK